MGIVLASASPRRKEILEKMGLEFSIIASDADESSSEKDPTKLVEILSERKANAIKPKVSKDDIIISADTVVVCGDAILGKPKDREDAKNMLSVLSGNIHRVISGVYVGKDKKSLVSHDVTYVYFKKLSSEEINNYLNENEYADKAGSYAIQGLGGAFVERIDGSYTNVIGLPEELTIKLLNEIRTCE